MSPPWTFTMVMLEGVGESLGKNVKRGPSLGIRYLRIHPFNFVILFSQRERRQVQ